MSKCPKCRTLDSANCHSINCPMRKQKGGKRTGSGRKKAAHKTKTVSFRVRVEWEPDIKQVVKSKILELNQTTKHDIN